MPDQQPQIIATMTITVDSLGNVQCNGPIQNRMLCYGMLEIARDIVWDYAQQAANRKVQPPSDQELAALAAVNRNKRSF